MIVVCEIVDGDIYVGDFDSWVCLCCVCVV